MRTNQPSALTRASVAELTGINPETLRYYEKEGLLDPPQRSATGYRLYGEEDLKRLNFVSRSKELGFSLRDIKEFIDLTGNPRTPRKELRDFANHRLRLIREKIRDLRAMEKALSSLVSECDGQGEVNGCPIADFVVEGRNSKTKERKTS